MVQAEPDMDLDDDFLENFYLEQNEKTGTYYFEVFVGSDLVSKKLLIDTLANGTAIKVEKSDKGVEKVDEHAKVFLPPDGYIEGNQMTDYVCIDSDADMCMQRYGFVKAQFIHIPGLNSPEDHLELEGVIPFNRYSQTQNIVEELIKEDVFWKYTLQLDLNVNFLSATWHHERVRGDSYVIFNGIDQTNIRFNDDVNDGFIFFDNQIEAGAWQVPISNITYGKANWMQHYLDDPNFEGIPALLATAQNSIKMPVYDFMQLLAAMKVDYKNVTFDGETGYIFGAKACRHYRFDNITFGFGSLDFEVPMFYFTREIEGKCHLLIEKNSDEQDPNYYLGGPFLRAFMVLLDMDKNRVGFANKIKHYGAEILGEGAPGPARPKNVHGLDRKDDPEDEVPDDGEQTGTDVPVDDTTEPDDGLGKIIDDARKEHQRQTRGSNKTSVIVFVIVVLLAMAFIILKCIVQKRKKDEDQASTFAQSTKEDLVTRQAKKNPSGGKRKKSKKKKQTTTIQNDESYDEDVEEKLDESLVITDRSQIEDEDTVLPMEQSTKEEDKENHEEE